jgi:hypothetical protein
MEILIQLILGVAHAMVFGIFITAATGKLSVCRANAQAMCIKGALDCGLALLAASIFSQQATKIAAFFAIIVAVVGGLREWKTHNSVCNCFGALTLVLHPWRNHSRALLSLGGILIIALQPRHAASNTHLLVGIAIGLAILLVASALVFARASIMRPNRNMSIDSIKVLAPNTISSETFVGYDSAGRSMTLGNIMMPGESLAILMTSPGCKACQELKARISPFLSSLPLPLITVIESDATDDELVSFFDKQGKWRRTLGVKSLPSMVILNENVTNIKYPIAMGEADILALLLHSTLRKPNSGIGSFKGEIRRLMQHG